MTTLRGQVTLRKDVLHHLGIKPGEKIELDKLPDGRVALRVAKPPGTIDGFLGLLAGKTKKLPQSMTSTRRRLAVGPGRNEDYG